MGSQDTFTAGHGTADSAVPSPVPGADAGTNPRFLRRLRFARWCILWTLGSLALMVPFAPFMELLLSGARSVGSEDGFRTWPPAVSTAVALLCALLCLCMIRSRVDGRRIADPRLYWGSLALLLLACLLMQVTPYVFLTCTCWWGVAAFSAPWRRSLLVGLALLVLPWLHLSVTLVDIPLFVLVFSSLFSVGWTLVIWFVALTMFRLWEATNEALEGEHARTRLAVSEERLRFAQDMQGVIGQGLTTLAVRARRAELLLGSDPAGSAAEIEEVHELARRVLQQVRSAVSGYRGVDLAAEVESIGAVLRANGTETVVTGTAAPEQFPAAAGIAAWVVREGATNILRHSDARRCRISFSVDGEAGHGGRALVVEVSNDRARGGPEDGAASASGLAGLSERVVREGGTLSANRTHDGGFLLRAVLPLPDGTRHTEESR
ncbi:sensor histidine kinase [Nocardiopsis dassonvillei]|uniref:Integral membrane sensor signal transduction histidine kinase n=1 Tax=Nocardiopsis dassonvillei (strain ATCC 23218 / DSM 43111 / CIP 107115 / JCM 7437 / KCTC 9190 / NBRC 14626 / NCTC 10488 / NRRL B-5397 / IMRU 509) TaxID=446468 RepID=D7B9K0_NOCDD|nr:histidine kinase [Nocardiopsis dassonvillei]ADH70858.1 integral membrane sensor signal transduction histidine kinase [Nocardiopsis dassonvillei subsp. dassonvillei DSM 43111]NKY78099.1 two-component sensor histidine kinase [Nocardiopsis dassonvillei]VEI91068.1 Sensor histidine kinase desK [Nocardiopsis dassonvillei]